MLVGLEECFEFLKAECLGAFLGEEFAEIFDFAVVHALVVYLRECVELGGQVAVVLHALGVGKHAHFLKAQEHRMERESRVGIVGIRVGPRVGHRRIVDRQKLEHGLSGGFGPVYHGDEVIEVAYTEVGLGAEREHGDGRAGAFPKVEGIDEAHAREHGGSVSEGSDAEGTVLSAFPHFDIAFVVDDEELELCAGLDSLGRNVDLPQGEVSMTQHGRFGRIPCSERFGLAADGHFPAFSDHRCGDAYGDISGSGNDCLVCIAVAEYTFGERCRVERLVEGLVLPAVVDVDLAGVRAGESIAASPLVLARTVVTPHEIAVIERRSGPGHFYGGRPVFDTVESHFDCLGIIPAPKFGQIACQKERLTPVGPIVNIEC